MLALGIFNQIESATLSGTFAGTHPASNLKTRYLSQKCRSTGTNWQLVLDLGTALNIGVVAAVATNMSATAVVRIEGASVSNFSSLAYDSGTLPSYQSADFAISFEPAAARYWRVTITDPGNSAGYVAVGRVFIGGRLRFNVNIDWGYSIGVESITAVTTSLGGCDFFDERPNRRVTPVKFSWLTDAEALTQLLPTLQMHDISKEFYLIFDDEDTTYRKQRNYLCRLKQLDAIASPYVNLNQVALNCLELI